MYYDSEEEQDIQHVGSTPDGQRGMVRVDDVTEAFMALPRMMQLIGDKMEGDSN